MELIFRSLPANEMERPPTQRDQFDNDDVELVDALVRESIQNSLDAAISRRTDEVHVRFDIVRITGADRVEAIDLLEINTLNEHLDAANLPTLQLDNCLDVLVIEDSGTTGLTGSWDSWDDGHFCDFWRRLGRSHKGGQALGRWGLGKLVFSSASLARVFFGLTVRQGEDTGLLMGQAVLTHHKMHDGRRLDSHAFYAVQGQLAGENFQLPERSQKALDDFRRLFDLKRTDEAGLSIVIPAPRESITLGRISQGVLRNYFFPILFGRLVVDVGDTHIDESTFSDLAQQLDAQRFANGHLADFIQSMKKTRDHSFKGLVNLPENWTKMNMDTALGEQLEALRKSFNDGELVMVRAPVLLKLKNGTEQLSFVDAFLQRAPFDMAPLFVRQAIVLNGEQRYFRGHKVFAALIADDGVVSEFLGDAENPAHTGWSASAEKVTTRWQATRDRLKDIRYLPKQLYDSLVSAVVSLDKSALASIFSLPSEDGATEPVPRGNEVRDPLKPKITSNPRSYRLLRVQNGFGVRADTLSNKELPMTVRVHVAYDITRGSPFKKHRPEDFDFTKNDLEIDHLGARVTAAGPNTLLIEATHVKFSVNVTGFDVNRDLIIAAQKTS